MAYFELKWALAGVKDFNADLEATANDRLMHRIFGGSGASVAERVVLVDKLWATQMFRKSGLTARVIARISEHADELEAMCSGLPKDALLGQPERVASVALEALPLVMGHDAAETARQHCPYSFASKFLHWTSPHHFPIMDSRAREQINRIQRGLGQKPTVAADGGYWRDDYPMWIAFFSEGIGALSQEDRDELLAFDLETQPEPHRCGNSLLRVLDKALYWGGPLG